MPSTRRQISAMAAHCSSLHSLVAPASRARSSNMRTAASSCERLDAHDTLAVDLERLATRREHPDVWAGPEHGRREVARVVEEVLAVVEHEQQVPHLEELDDALGQRQPGPLLATDRIRDHLRHEQVVVGGGELTHPRAVGEVGLELGCHLQREPGLAHAAGTRERHEARVVQRVDERRHLVLAADERRELRRQVADRGPAPTADAGTRAAGRGARPGTRGSASPRRAAGAHRGRPARRRRRARRAPSRSVTCDTTIWSPCARFISRAARFSAVP